MNTYAGWYGDDTLEAVGKLRWDVPADKPLLFALCLLPLAWLVIGALADTLGANPAEALIRATGDWTLRFLCLLAQGVLGAIALGLGHRGTHEAGARRRGRCVRRPHRHRHRPAVLPARRQAVAPGHRRRRGELGVGRDTAGAGDAGLLRALLRRGRLVVPARVRRARPRSRR